jgi:hypothetical protein
MVQALESALLGNVRLTSTELGCIGDRDCPDLPISSPAKSKLRSTTIFPRLGL